MGRCTSCSAELQPAWKFCIHCGTAVIPSAIRPDVAASAPRTRVTALGLFGWALGGLLVAIAIAAGVLLGR